VTEETTTPSSSHSHSHADELEDYGGGHVLVASDDPSELVPLEVVEQRYVARVMEAVGGNKTLAARILGVDRKTLYRKLRGA